MKFKYLFIGLFASLLLVSGFAFSQAFAVQNPGGSVSVGITVPSEFVLEVRDAYAWKYDYQSIVCEWVDDVETCRPNPVSKSSFALSMIESEMRDSLRDNVRQYRYIQYVSSFDEGVEVVLT